MRCFRRMPECADTILFLVLQWKLQILDGNILVGFGILLDGMLNR